MTLHVYEELEQGSDAWLAARAGIVTASTVGKLITPTGKIANNDTSRALVATLAAERITGHVDETPMNSHMWRGVEEEPIARDFYAEVTGETVTEVGLMVREDNGIRLGASPDGLVGDDGGIEIKSRLQKKHVQTVLEDRVPPENVLQIQTCLFVSGRDWWDYISFSAGMAFWTKRVYPDSDLHSVIAAAVAKFEEDVQAIVSQYEAATHGLPLTEPRADLDDITI